MLDGKIYVTGGDESFDEDDPPLSSTEVYDPAAGAWHAGTLLSIARGFSCSVPL